MAQFHLAASVSGFWYCSCDSLSWLTGTLEKSRAVANVITNTCAFPTSQNVCCENDLLKNFLVFNMNVRPGFFLTAESAGQLRAHSYEWRPAGCSAPKGNGRFHSFKSGQFRFDVPLAKKNGSHNTRTYYFQCKLSHRHHLDAGHIRNFITFIPRILPTTPPWLHHLLVLWFRCMIHTSRCGPSVALKSLL